MAVQEPSAHQESGVPRRVAAAKALAQFDRLDSAWISCSQIARELRISDSTLRYWLHRRWSQMRHSRWPPSVAQFLESPELEAIALDCSPTLVQAAMRVWAAEGAFVQAGLYPNPVIGYRAEEVGNEGTAGMQGVAFSQELITGGKLRLNLIDHAQGGQVLPTSRA